MKSLMLHSMFAAATLVAVAGSASAQNLKAEIPFAFRAGTALMQPGTYDVIGHTDMAAKMFGLYNRDTRQSVALIRRATRDASKAWIAKGRPTLVFRCAGADCALAEVWTGGAESTLFGSPKSANGDPIRMVEVRLSSNKAD